MSEMVHHQCFRGIDCYSSPQKLLRAIHEPDGKISINMLEDATRMLIMGWSSNNS